MDTNGLTFAEKKLNKKLNFHSWIASIIALLSVVVFAFIVYGKAVSEIDSNSISHKKFASKDSLIELKVNRIIRNQDVMYLNLLKLAKKLNVDLSKEEEFFLNSNK